MEEWIKKSDVVKELNTEAREQFRLDDSYAYVIEALRNVEDAINSILSADRPQGYWIKTDVATYRCSECGKIQIADDVNELNYCCCCGSRNKVRRMKGADDE